MPSFDKGSFSERAATTRAALPSRIHLIINIIEDKIRINANREDSSFPQARSVKAVYSRKTGLVFPGAYIN